MRLLRWRLRRRPVRESTVEAALVRECRLRGFACLKLTPSSPGVPDRLVVARGGAHTFVEVKAPGRCPRAAQRRWRTRLADLGHEVCVVDHPAGARALVAASDDMSYTGANSERTAHPKESS